MVYRKSKCPGCGRMIFSIGSISLTKDFFKNQQYNKIVQDKNTIYYYIIKC